jgi:hypothetical protein
MTATVTESPPELPIGLPESRMGGSMPEHFVEAKRGFWSSLAKVAKGIITRIGKTAEDGNYYVYPSEPERVQESRQPIWFGRMTMWIDRPWSNPSGSNRFASEHHVKRSRDELAYRRISPR